MNRIANRTKALAGAVKENGIEIYTFLLLALGVPAVAYVYYDWRAALAVFVVSQIGIGFLALRNDR